MTKDADELLPCPFCGGAACIDEFEHDYGVKYFGRCMSCSAELSATYPRSEAIAAWNRRAALSPEGH